MSIERISHYEIVAILGEGAMGRVYRARDVNLDRPVALKMVSERIADDIEFLTRFRREARLAASLNHPHIATIHQFGEDEGKTFIVMELVEGETLGDRIKAGALSPGEVRRLGAQAASALAAAHARGIVHRDIKPANLMITRGGDIKVMDFGVAKRTGETQVTMTGALVGTANIMAPEMLEGKQPTPASDLFSLGCVLYEALAGRPAFHGGDIMTVLHQITTREPTSLRELCPGAPDDLVRVIEGLLVKDPDARLGPSEAVAAALRGETAAPAPVDETMAGTDPGATMMADPGATMAANDVPGTAAGATPAPAGGFADLGRRFWWIPLAVVSTAFALWFGFVREGEPPPDRELATDLNNQGMVTMDALGDPPDAVEVARAETSFREAIAADPEWAKPWTHLGKLAFLQGDFSDAARHCERALELEPEDPGAWANLGDAYFELQRWREAKEAFRSAMAHDRTDDQEFRLSAASNLAYIFLFQEGNADSALAVLEPMQGDFSHGQRFVEAVLWKNLGWAQLAAGRLEDAEGSLRRALDLVPSYPVARAGLAAVAEARGDAAGAERLWAEVSEDPNTVAGLRDLAREVAGSR